MGAHRAAGGRPLPNLRASGFCAGMPSAMHGHMHCTPLLFAALFTLGCGEVWEPMAPDHVCKEVGFAISNRTYACSNDEALALRRFKAFERAYGCQIDSLDAPIEHLYRCPISVKATPCADVRAFGDDLDAWLPASCELLLTTPDGMPWGAP